MFHCQDGKWVRRSNSEYIKIKSMIAICSLCARLFLSFSNRIDGRKYGTYTSPITITTTTTTKRKDIIQIFLCFLVQMCGICMRLSTGLSFSLSLFYSLTVRFFSVVVQQNEHNVNYLFLTRRIFFCTSFILLHVVYV